jgi:alcohol dehydrogenase, propanol-preferring
VRGAVKVGNVRPGDLVLVSGIGGLGHLALQYAKIFGGTEAAVDITDEKLALARDLAEVLRKHGGADVAIEDVLHGKNKARIVLEP